MKVCKEWDEFIEMKLFPPKAKKILIFCQNVSWVDEWNFLAAFN